MAIHRAAHLSDPSTRNSGPTLLVTYNRSLAGYLEHLAGEYNDKFDIRTYGRFARGYLKSIGWMGWNKIASAFTRAELVRRAIADVRATYPPNNFFDKPLDFFLAELDWMDGFGIHTDTDYLAASRIGRHTPLHPTWKPVIWLIRNRYRAYLVGAQKTCDWSSIVTLVRQGLTQDAAPRKYKHIVVDEVQDFTPEAVRSLTQAVQEGGTITFFADYAQQIYGHRVSWQSVNLPIRKQEIFSHNYRNTAEIARLALAMANMPHFKDLPDLVMPTSTRAAGAPPTLVRCANEEQEAQIVVRQATDLGKFAKIGILTRTRDDMRRATAGLTGVHVLHEDTSSWADENGIYAGTYHSGKGLEFDLVILPFCGQHRMPDPGVIQTFGEQDAMAREARLLYVGVTRARNELLITYSGTLTPLFPPSNSEVWTEASSAPAR